MSLEFLTSDNLEGVQHGFYTRKGGASSGIFRGLNCGTASSDQSEIVAINRSRVAKSMSVDVLNGVYQVHSAKVETISGPISGNRPKADALVTATPDLALTVLTADCQPILFADKHAQVIAAAHAGWRGAVDGIVENTIVAMEQLGATRENINAAIGPCISQAAYEVGPEFLDTFTANAPDNARFFIEGDGDRYMFDLPSFGLHCLTEAGVGSATWIGHCTYADPDRFFSYRRTTHAGEADYGRLVSAIKL